MLAQALEPVVLLLKQRFSGFFGISFAIHALFFLAGILYFYSWPSEEHYVATVQLYTGDADTNNPNRTTGKGNKDADKNEKRNKDDIGTGQNANQAFDWGTASDPSIDGGTRYTANLVVDITADDYPVNARKANIGKVTVAVTIGLSGADGKVKDVKIRYIRSPGDAHKPFENDFIIASRNILLYKTRLANNPYKRDGVPKDFIWDTVINFTLQ